MKRRFVGVLLIALAGCGVAAPQAEDQTAMAGEAYSFEADADPVIAALPFVEAQLIVQPYPGADPQALNRAYQTAGARVIDELPEIDAVVLEVPADAILDVAAKLAAGGLIENIQKNYIFSPDAAPNDPLFPRQDHLSQIAVSGAWDISVGEVSIPIAIVDTGVDGDHPDLAEKIIGGVNLYDGNDDFSDTMGHGTQVAGTAAALSNNGVGVAGVAWECPILAVRVGDAQGLSTSRNIAAGILWSVAHGAKVINVSFAPLWSDKIVRSAAQQAFNRGSLVVISAGNAGGTNTAVGYEEAVFVGAVNATSQIASFSDKGPFVDIVAPGTGVRTTARGGDYSMANGTSFAAPIVSGLAGLIWSVQSDLRPASVIERLLDTAVDLGAAGEDDVYGVGLVNAAEAVGETQRLGAQPDNTPPTLRITKPTTNESLSGRYTAAVEATDASGVADVVLSIDNVPFATDTRAPYQFVIDVSAFSAGSHTLTFVARDAAGNASSPRTVNVRFAASTGGRAGTITFRSPTNGSTVSGDVTVQASVSDPDGLALVEWWIDGQSVYVTTVTGTTSGISYLWRGSAAAVGAHSIALTITDANGGQSTGVLNLTRR